MASLPITPWPTEQAEIVPLPRPRLVAVETAAQPAVAAARLSVLEWSIVALAERDSIASLREPGRIAAALESLFGLHRPNKLANPRLEVLRRLAVFVWRQGWKVPKSELQAFLAEGFTLDHYELVQASIAASRNPALKRGSIR
ncbi:hypothetical protein [Sphingomonas glaciei]|uniref:Uncharacterized protein n=1 Tax=Sphingomonas glaciei TaxID=2938948 RepID=A0ABY5MVP7_9SPHN|nr:hypothetical protein [Sphingomonas glaciei]UUR08517.1 hypothetical protein M1K48_02410 [Sphingomonas glaciei]